MNQNQMESKSELNQELVNQNLIASGNLYQYPALITSVNQ